MDARRGRRYQPEIVELILGAGLLTMLVLGGLGLWQTHRAEMMRCYALAPPLNQSEQFMLAGGLLDCMFQGCRTVIHFTPSRGVACFFRRPFSGDKPATGVWPSAIVQGERAHDEDHAAGRSVAQSDAHLALNHSRGRG